MLTKSLKDPAGLVRCDLSTLEHYMADHAEHVTLCGAQFDTADGDGLYAWAPNSGWASPSDDAVRMLVRDFCA